MSTLLTAMVNQVEAAARVANAHGFISELPEGYETVVGAQVRTRMCVVHG